MKTKIVIAALLLTTLQTMALSTRPVEQLIERIAPGHGSRFKLELIEAESGKDVSEVAAAGQQIVLRGNNCNALSRAFGFYLSEVCHASVSWHAAAPVELPKTLPLPTTTIRRVCPYKHRFFFNYCTFGYTTPFWSWQEWERCIDWMALNGINMPLAITGTEKVLQKMWQAQGFSDETIRSFFTGPAHLPWLHMNMIAKWGGPCPQSYIDYGYEMQKKILKRERSLGMTPILPAFSGRVPVELKEKSPGSKISVLGTGWHMFDKEHYTYFLDPYDPLFNKLQKSFMEELIKLYGTDHYYGVDPFNEVTPPSWDLDYLAQTSRTIYESMSAVDKDAVWIQMGWLFYFDGRWTNERVKSLITAVPEGKLIMLDYFCENTEIWRKMDSFFGVPFIWCYLGNFGGHDNLVGPLEVIRDRLHATRKEHENKGNLWGVGSTLEGFGQNRMVFEFLFHEAWADKPTDLNQWIVNYSRNRAGDDPSVAAGWKQLLEKVYTKGGVSWDGSCAYHSRPRLKGTFGNVIGGPHFATQDLLVAWQEFMKAGPEARARDSFRYDLANTIRQYLEGLASELRNELAYSYETGSAENTAKIGKMMLELIKDQDRLMKSRPESLLGNWTHGAQAIGRNESEDRAIEINLRNLLTTWGKESIPLSDYCRRDWAGLLGTYYHGRWELFVNDLNQAMASGKNFDPAAFEKKVIAFEQHWIHQDRTAFTNQPEGDTWAIATELFAKYRDLRLPKRIQTEKTHIASWKAEQLKDGEVELHWDITPHLSGAGLYLFHFNYRSGKQALSISKASIKSNGAEVSADVHKGFSGYTLDGHIYRLEVKEVIPGARYTLHALVKGAGGSDSNGDVLMEKTRR